MEDCCLPAAGGSAPIAPVVQRSEPETKVVTDCPACGERGKAVDIQTVKAMLALSLEVLHPADYRFCRTEECPVVYFSTDGLRVFREEDLRERVHQKHPDDEAVFVCYCFRHTPGSIRAELDTQGISTVVERISAGVQAGQCACEIRNPQGSCCLGNVRAVVKRLQKT